ncbi:lipoyl(octanoyl) transferase LipB [Alkalibaculum sp. M08DMB]|uniref:Octanoyltransferase n=1 Tax=Alkalibaculum sporogenes TaxID=2655001 RepID=A0A6A7K630_9FIRM|nr:lipoyl(octanoyl) transferase LipB [Alkalibaculum sporogenes]MPW24824.1 lipoyl(octanoyl) transferase LipB [Alkalibaculum sporogenes]
MNINIVDLGIMDYGETLIIQERLRKLRIENKIEDTLLIVEHLPVLTLGCRGKKSNILVTDEFLKQKGINVINLNRGGDVTYHGPGQIVGYPIINLKNYNRDVRNFVWKLKEIFIRMLREQYKINVSGLDGEYTGVWFGNDKIVAIGIAISRMVSMHGFAFNVNTNLEDFRWINPCGFTDKGVTSLEKLLGHSMNMDEVKQLTINYFIELFEANQISLSLEELNNILEENNHG